MHRDRLKLARNANTDNKGYKTCHGFCKPFLLSRENSIRGQHLDRAPALNQTRVWGQVTCSQQTLYRDTRKTQETCNSTAKTAPCFTPSGWCRDSTPRQLFCSNLHSLSNAYTLYCRAVMGNAARYLIFNHKIFTT